MKKYSILYTHKRTGEQFWSSSDDGRGGSYSLHRKSNEIPSSKEATAFYGKRAIEHANKRILNDQKFFESYNYKGLYYDAEIIEYEAEPEWYFELWYVLEYAYGQSPMKEVLKSFPLDKNIDYKLRPGRTRPLIDDLPLEELERYYRWRKEHYKGTKKEV